MEWINWTVFAVSLRCCLISIWLHLVQVTYFFLRGEANTVMDLPFLSRSNRATRQQSPELSWENMLDVADLDFELCDDDAGTNQRQVVVLVCH